MHVKQHLDKLTISVLNIDDVDKRTGESHSTNKSLYVTKNTGTQNEKVEFRHTNGTRGIGVGYDTIYVRVYLQGLFFTMDEK